jgi:hypothetical protein
VLQGKLPTADQERWRIASAVDQKLCWMPRS